MGLGGTPTTAVEVNAPSLWSGGIEWGTAETPGAIGYWQTAAAATARTGTPTLSIAIGGRRIVEQLNSAQWTLGQADWMATLSPSTASFTFVGAVDASLNGDIVVGVMSSVTDQHSDALWVGRVDSLTTMQDVAGNYWSTIQASDVIGVLGEARAPADQGTGVLGTLQTLTKSLAADAGINVVVETSDTLSDIYGDVEWATTPYDASLLEFINRMARTSNAILVLQGNGHLRAAVRQAAAGSVETTPLTGPDSFTTWTEMTSLGNVLNSFRFGGITGWTESGLDFEITSSIDAYGSRAFEVGDMLSPNSGPYSGSGMLEALATPRAVVTGADFPVTDLSQRVLWLDPLDWVTHDTDAWQVMSVQHSASPGDWRVTITADQTQNYLLDTTDPTPSDPPVTGTTTITQTYISTKSASVLSTGGGNGAGDYLAVGRDAGTSNHVRSFIQFPIPSDWTDDFPGFVEVVSATVTLRTATQAGIEYGASPKYYVRRVTGSWSEGSHAGTGSYDSGNSINWANQPKVTTTGQKVKSHDGSESTDRDVAVTEIAQGWHDHGNNGLRLSAYDESATRHTIEFYSDDHATSGWRPVLRLKCRVTV